MADEREYRLGQLWLGENHKGRFLAMITDIVTEVDKTYIEITYWSMPDRVAMGGRLCNTVVRHREQMDEFLKELISDA